MLATVGSMGIFIASSRAEPKQDIKFEQKDSGAATSQIIVDLGGAVKRPAVYTLPASSRLKDLIDRAGGLARDADLGLFQRTFNLARVIRDQEKIYIPSTGEGSGGQSLSVSASTDIAGASATNLIDINTASISQLDTLSGVGPVTAQKIIDARPYISINELLTKKVLSNSTFQKIQNLITVN